MVKCSWIQLLSKTKELLRLLAAKQLYLLIVTINIEHLSKDVFFIQLWSQQDNYALFLVFIYDILQQYLIVNFIRSIFIVSFFAVHLMLSYLFLFKCNGYT